MSEAEDHPSVSSLPLSEDGGVELREDCVAEDGPVLWRRSIDVLEAYRRLRYDPSPIVSNGDHGPMIFSTAHDREELDRLNDFRVGFRSQNHVTHSYLFTLNAFPIENGEFVLPADHLSELLSSWSDVRETIYSVFDAAEWEYCRVLEPTPMGYPRVRLAVLADDTVDNPESVVDAHVENCKLASDEIHDYDHVIHHDRGMKVDEHFEDNLSGVGDNRQEDWHSRAFDALLFATGTNRLAFSDGGADYAGAPSVNYSPQTVEI